MEELIVNISEFVLTIGFLEAMGLIFGLLAVIFLIKENIWTWPCGIVYVLISFVIFWKANLYLDFALHVFFLVLNIYGWWYWIKGEQYNNDELPVTTTSKTLLIYLSLISGFLIFALGYVFKNLTDQSVPYWDSATTVLSLTGMWLTARKKIENWYFWFVVDVLATGIYIYKELYFYAVLYLIYIGLAIAGYLSWKKSMKLHLVG